MKKEEIGILHAKPFWHFFVAILKLIYPKYYKHWLYILPHKEILESFLFYMYLGSFALPYFSTKLNEYS